MTYELRESSCLLFRNDRGKQQNANAPDWKGELLINGKAHDAAIWIKQGQRGEYLSLSLKAKDAMPSPRPFVPRLATPKTNGPANEPELPMPPENEDVPF